MIQVFKYLSLVYLFCTTLTSIAQEEGFKSQTLIGKWTLNSTNKVSTKQAGLSPADFKKNVEFFIDHSYKIDIYLTDTVISVKGTWQTDEFLLTLYLSEQIGSNQINEKYVIDLLDKNDLFITIKKGKHQYSEGYTRE